MFDLISHERKEPQWFRMKKKIIHINAYFICFCCFYCILVLVESCKVHEWVEKLIHVVIPASDFKDFSFLCHNVHVVTVFSDFTQTFFVDNVIPYFRTFSTESSQGKSVTDSLLHKYGRFILRPADIKQVTYRQSDDCTCTSLELVWSKSF